MCRFQYGKYEGTNKELKWKEKRSHFNASQYCHCTIINCNRIKRSLGICWSFAKSKRGTSSRRTKLKNMTFLHFKEILCPIKTQQGFFKCEENLPIFQSNLWVNNSTEVRLYAFCASYFKKFKLFFFSVRTGGKLLWICLTRMRYSREYYTADIKK